SLSPRQTPLRQSPPPSRLPAGHRGPNYSAAAVVTTTSTKAEQASPTWCERRSISSTPTRKPRPKTRPDSPPGRVAEGGIACSQLSRLHPTCIDRAMLRVNESTPYSVVHQEQTSIQL